MSRGRLVRLEKMQKGKHVLVFGWGSLFVKQRNGFLPQVFVNGQDHVPDIRNHPAIEAFGIGKEGVLVDDNVQNVRDVRGLQLRLKQLV